MGFNDGCSNSNSHQELQTLLRVMPELKDLATRQPGDPELPSVHYASHNHGGIYPMVHIPVYGRAGTLWVGRLPGAGPSPLEEEVDALKAFGIGRVICLVTERVAGMYMHLARERFQIGFRRLEVPDFGTPPSDDVFEKELASTDEALGKGAQVLVHCHAGCGRTGMFVSCLLVRGGDAPSVAIRRFRRLRGCGPETPEQAAYVVRYARRWGEGIVP